MGSIRTIPGFSSYSATTDGRIWSGVSLRYMKGSVDRDGYLKVKVIDDSGKRRFIATHRLVAFAYLEPPIFNDPTVNHKDRNKQNNRPENLEWISRANNTRFALEEDFRTIPDEVVLKIRALANKGVSYKEISDIFGMSLHVAWQTANNRYIHLGNIPPKRYKIVDGKRVSQGRGK